MTLEVSFSSCNQTYTACDDQNWAPNVAQSLWTAESRASSTDEHWNMVFSLSTHPENETPVDDEIEPPAPYPEDHDQCDPTGDRWQTNQPSRGTENDINTMMGIPISENQSPVGEIGHLSIPCSHTGDAFDSAMFNSSATVSSTHSAEDSTNTIIWHDLNDSHTFNSVDPASNVSSLDSKHALPNEDSSTGRTNDNQTATSLVALWEAKVERHDTMVTDNDAVPAEWKQAMIELDKLGFDHLEDNAKALNAAGGDFKRAIAYLNP